MSTGRDELDRLAGEYVLGLLDEDEQAAFESRLSHAADARLALRQAQERFAELDATAPPADAPPDLWARIENELAISAPIDLNAARARRSKAPVRSGFWRGFATAAAAALVIAAVGIGTFRSVIAPEPQLIVVLLNAEAQPGAIVEAYYGQKVRVVPLQRFDIPEGKTLQVWTLWSREIGPKSVGLVEGSGATTLSNDLPEPRPDQFYEITLEQAGGSPTGKPTGPVLAKGFARQPQI
jgi:anti-sigma-K factor RskA